ncbi:MAG: cyclic pyranopterin monophosphate synthase MoaC [Elusimicrobiota bacterium]
MKRPSLSHVDVQGKIKMVDVSGKSTTMREASAYGEVHLKAQTIKLIKNGLMRKGDVLSTARLAGIMAGKRTDELIPLCHSLQIESLDVSIKVLTRSIQIQSRVVCEGKTGVEMEALTAVSVAALTIYDMAKAVDKNIVIGPIYLSEKKGGKSGHFKRGKI